MWIGSRMRWESIRTQVGANSLFQFFLFNFHWAFVIFLSRTTMSFSWVLSKWLPCSILEEKMFYQSSKHPFLSAKSLAAFSLSASPLKIKHVICNIFSGVSCRTFTLLQRGEHNMALITCFLHGRAKAFNEWTLCWQALKRLYAWPLAFQHGEHLPWIVALKTLGPTTKGYFPLYRVKPMRHTSLSAQAPHTSSFHSMACLKPVIISCR